MGFLVTGEARDSNRTGAWSFQSPALAVEDAEGPDHEGATLPERLWGDHYRPIQFTQIQNNTIKKIKYTGHQFGGLVITFSPPPLALGFK